MTSRFILDLHEAADPRFDQSNTATGSRTSTLIFPATLKHAPHYDSDLSFGIGTIETDHYDPMDDDHRTGAGVAEGCNSERQWENQHRLEAATDRLSVIPSQYDDVESVIWIR
ncbi:hypothetical protein VTO73DRAFT_10934 [Trametes versicolor]